MITISELRALNKKNGGHFFDRAVMKVAGETLKSFRLEKTFDPDVVHLCRKKANVRGEVKEWSFDVTTGKMLNGWYSKA